MKENNKEIPLFTEEQMRNYAINNEGRGTEDKPYFLLPPPFLIHKDKEKMSDEACLKFASEFVHDNYMVKVLSPARIELAIIDVCNGAKAYRDSLTKK